MDFPEIEDRIRRLEVKYRPQLSQFDFDNIEDYLQHGEYGLAFELLCTQLDEHDVVVDDDESLAEMRLIAEAMGLSPVELVEWEQIRKMQR